MPALLVIQEESWMMDWAEVVRAVKVVRRIVSMCFMVELVDDKKAD